MQAPFTDATFSKFKNFSALSTVLPCMTVNVLLFSEKFFTNVLYKNDKLLFQNVFLFHNST